MKKYIIIGAAVVLVLLVALWWVKVSTQAPLATPPAQEVPAEALEPLYNNEASGFSLQGPPGWVKKYDHLGMLVTYLDPKQTGDFQANISVAEEEKGDLDLEAYVEASMTQIAEFFPSFELLERSDATVQGQKAQRVTYRMETEGLSLDSAQLIIDRGEDWLVLTFVSETAAFGSTQTAFRSVVDSLKFLGS